MITPCLFFCKDCTNLIEPGEIRAYGKMRSWATVTKEERDAEEKCTPGFTTYTCKEQLHPDICGKSILNESEDDDYTYEIIKVQKRKRRTWKCECGTELISYPLDADTLMRIPNFDGCPICGAKGKLIKREI